ncbi:MAG: HYR domain-containing protein, partial [Bacteroidota bacterium]
MAIVWLLLICFPFHASAQCTIVCKSALNVSLPPSGTAVISPDILLEDDDCDPLDFYVDIIDPQGNSLGNNVGCAFVGQSLLAGVFHQVNGNSCYTTLHIQDYIRPQIPPQDTTVLCIEPFGPDAIGTPLIMDNCSISELSYTDELIELGCLSIQNGDTLTSRVERTWTATDVSGNVTTGIQNIYIKRATIADVVFPPHRDGFALAALDCMDDPNNLALTGEPTVAGRPLSGGGTCEFVVSHSDQTIADCGTNSYKILRTWTVIDWCTGDFVLNVQIIKVADTTAPSIQCPADLVVGTNAYDCLGTVNLPLALATDDCSSVNIEPNWAFGTGYGPFFDIPLGQHLVTYTAEDACGNTSSCTMTVTVIDDIIPVMVCDANTVVYLNSAGIVEVAATAFDDGSSDNCAVDRLEVSRDGVQYNTAVQFDCLDANQVIEVYLRAYDLVGNYNECNVEVTVREAVKPVIACPADVQLTCIDDLTDLSITGEALAVDACGLDSIFYSDSTELNSCGVGQVDRTWTAIDIHGNTRSCIQQITIIDPSPVEVFFPADYSTYTCQAPVDTSVTGQPQVIYDCEEVGLNYSDQVFEIAVPACYKIFRTWTVIDWCTYVPNSGSDAGYYTHIQVISVFDELAPVLVVPADTLVGALGDQCNGTFVNLNPASATDCSESVTIINDSPYAIATGADA